MAIVLGFLLPPSSSQAASVPSGLPSHFGFGVSAGQGDTWMPQTGTAWDYRMQYLVGGVNTGSGWETWNSNGTFALNYATESAQHGYIPVFPYYELLQSSGSCGSCAENQKDLTNLNTSSLMQAYYTNFALLMKRLGPGNYDGIQGFGKAALINVEPDFSGGYAVQASNNNGVCFGFCTGQGNDPNLLKASVASSGFAAVAGYPNTYAGFTRALAHLRDLYAPNVLLGLDVSPWATGDDIGADTSASTDAVSRGQQVGVFLNLAGPHDILFNNPLDRDAGQYKAVFGQNRWWDRQNVTFPNFHRWEQYLQASSAADGGKAMLLWQVPEGNQAYFTENNTNGHYQDNRAEYIFGHVSELIGANIVGAIFAAGNAGNSTHTDAMNDGITNPGQICTTDGTSSGQICTTRTSSVADDDGGFIRFSGQAYYQHPVALSGGTPPTSTPVPSVTPTVVLSPTTTPVTTAGYTTSAVSSPGQAAPGSTVTITSSVKSGQASTVLIDVEVYDAAFNKVFQQAIDNQTFTAGQTRSFTSSWQIPAGAAPGSYTVMIGVFGSGWGALRAWNSSAGNVSVSSAATSMPTVRPTSTPTARPTNTPTARPTNTATARPANTPTTTPVLTGFSSSGAVSPAAVKRGAGATIGVSVTSATAASALVDLEIYDASGVKVFQQAWDNRAFTAGQTQTFTTSWLLPSSLTPGDYTLSIGVFSVGWGTLYNWHSQVLSVG